MRINGFEQIKAFYTIVFSQEFPIKPQHVSLYIFLVNQNNRNNWVEWFKCPLDLAMMGACIGSKKTYYACLDDLQEWELIKYKQGENLWKAPQIRLEVLKSSSMETSTVPQSEQVPIQLPTLVGIQLDTPNIKPTTSNLQPVTEDPFKVFLSQLNQTWSRQFKPVEKYKLKFQAAINNGYTVEEIITAAGAAKKDKHHIENNFKWLTPEFICRPDKIDIFLQAAAPAQTKNRVTL